MDSSSLFVDEAGDPLDSSSAGQPPDGGLGDALNVVAEDPPEPLGTSLAQSLAPFTASGRDGLLVSKIVLKI